MFLRHRLAQWRGSMADERGLTNLRGGPWSASRRLRSVDYLLRYPTITIGPSSIKQPPSIILLRILLSAARRESEPPRARLCPWNPEPGSLVKVRPGQGKVAEKAAENRNRSHSGQTKYSIESIRQHEWVLVRDNVQSMSSSAPPTGCRLPICSTIGAENMIRDKSNGFRAVTLFLFPRLWLEVGQAIAQLEGGRCIVNDSQPATD
ncbi:hypothetical protein BGZ61DRAFT_482352 [Ilyonectria robusta]|uniref:uncharacterized protein n=1 Tax=Ilyonectria robusta TaxID=1079257 RepID=UPI001E8D79DB|nr:uncharacterized protein BGZ61DRAFT_482352 [Ilyonectria robusta]KAH8673102.1 hypothetical protein BGZ61DRAFT_482352 [Ilyonectria robusta]